MITGATYCCDFANGPRFKVLTIHSITEEGFIFCDVLFSETGEWHRNQHMNFIAQNWLLVAMPVR
jgi:hypothetical protein